MSSIKNEKGVTLLFSIVILFILSSVLLHFITMYESEKRFLELEREWNNLDQLIIGGTKEVINLMEENESGHLVAGRLDFFNGTIHYQIVQETPNEKAIFLQAYTNNGKYRGARFRYHVENKTITGWMEGAQIK
ncbi:competence protein ComGG [Evansella vedderi]|uniref:Competence protein ComGG n=1 Tax=Evansella vedderi TaxID=38282 RepID=A0ABU0A0P5_9BACI|nr:competence type IV pilus minor pilin ComGG [Evansella vedderi]MDQ0256283.1 competence protein ComGG [Evansella vedderi]